jgi:NAD(P)-dependent dehydrogenase (short-subunit alcohol dehydrogenase family)
MTSTARPSNSLEGRIALVTGAAHRLGRALALAFADAGAHVIVHYHTSETAAESLVAAIEAKGRRGLSVSQTSPTPPKPKPPFARPSRLWADSTSL